MTRAVLYARLSAVGNDPDNIPDQLRKARAYAEQRGWEIVGEYHDDDVSAFKSDRVRADYDRMVAEIAKGNVDAIVTRHHDRIARNMETFAKLVNQAFETRHKLVLHCYTGGEYDLSTSAGGSFAFFQTMNGWGESAKTSERVREAVDRNRRKGKRVGGGPRWFGYQYVYDRPDLPAWIIGDDGKQRHSGRRIIDVVLDEAEASLIQDAAKRVLRGESLRSIAKEWKDTGIKKVKGGEWTGGALSQLLESPHLAALVHWKGEVFPAEWPAVLDRQTHERLVALLHSPGRKKTQPGSGERKHLLSGLLYCGSCGGRMTCAVPQNPKSERKNSIGNVGARNGKGRGRSYACRKDLSDECAKRARIDADSLEQFVIGHVVDLWKNKEVLNAATADVDVSDQLVDLADQIAGLKEDLRAAYDDLRVHKIIDRDTYLQTKATIDARIEAADKERDALTSRVAIADLPDIDTAWELLTEPERRVLLELLTPRIVIGPHPTEKDDDTGKMKWPMRPYADPDREDVRRKEVLKQRVIFD